MAFQSLNNQFSDLPDLPWERVNGKGGVQSRFFPALKIAGENWDKLFPYRLMVVDVTKGNQVVNGSEPDKIEVVVRKGTSSSLIDLTPFGSSWIFDLPITPQQLTITDQFAISTTATLRGIIEEHNGLRFKMINAAGTMGVWPQRESVTKPPAQPTPVQAVFGGTIEAFGNLKDQAQSVINAATNSHPATKPISKRPEDTSVDLESTGLIGTGYYNALKLQQFLEQYAEAKRDPNNTGWRLVFDIPKQNQSFVVTPMQYVWNQNQNEPMDIRYSFQLKAWRRISLDKFQANIPAETNPISPGALQKALNTLTSARAAVSAAVTLIGAVRSDVSKPLDVLRQTSLLIKDLSGAVVTAADLPSQLIKDYKSAIGDFMNTLGVNGFQTNVSSNTSVVNSLNAFKESSKSREGLSIDAVDNNQLGVNSAYAQSIDPANNIFSKPESNFTLMDQVPLNNLQLTVVQQNAIDTVIENARALTVDDLRQFRATIQTLAQQLANNFGAGDAFVSQVYSLPPPIVRVMPMTVDDYEILKSLYDVLAVYDTLTATTEIDDNNRTTNMEYVAGLADDSGIQFNTTAAKILVPVPFGLSIESIALRYLNDPQRWIEIVTLNNLKDPYIDEDGFQLPLLSNATGRQITVSSPDNLYLGQRVLLKSSTQSASARKILGIDRLSDTSFLITLDGIANLDNYVTADGAYMQAYLPGTVNSQQKIFIPSDLPIPNDPNITIPPLAATDPLSGMSKVDWLLTDTGDLAVNNFGDLRIAYGITNIIQALKIKFGTKKGTVLLHPEFGLAVQPGTVNSDVRVQEVASSINELIRKDPRFSGITNLQITLSGPTLTISLGVTLAGQSGVYPVTFQLAA